MKNFLLATVSAFFLFGIIGTTSAAINETDQGVILQQVEVLRRAVNRADSPAIIEIMSPNALALFRQEIQLGVDGKFVKFQQGIDEMNETEPGK